MKWMFAGFLGVVVAIMLISIDNRLQRINNFQRETVAPMHQQILDKLTALEHAK